MSKILVVVDMQNDFISGSLGTKEAQMIVPQVISKIQTYKEAAHQVVYTRDTHTTDYMNTMEGKKLPVMHCIIDSWGWKIESDIQKVMTKNDIVLNKETFGSVTLGEMIKKMVDKDPNLEVELVGLCTDICVISNALLIKAFAPEVIIKVDSSCCAGVTPDSHMKALEAMTMCQIEVQK